MTLPFHSPPFLAPSGVVHFNKRIDACALWIANRLHLILHPIINATKGDIIMAFSYACKDFEGMEDCPGKVVAATEQELWKLIEIHAAVAHGEDVSTWDETTRAAVAKLIKTE
jgi:hypothetical protein